MFNFLNWYWSINLIWIWLFHLCSSGTLHGVSRNVPVRLLGTRFTNAMYCFEQDSRSLLFETPYNIFKGLHRLKVLVETTLVSLKNTILPLIYLPGTKTSMTACLVVQSATAPSCSSSFVAWVDIRSFLYDENRSTYVNQDDSCFLSINIWISVKTIHCLYNVSWDNAILKIREIESRIIAGISVAHRIYVPRG
jgi:hypothetical protein